MDQFLLDNAECFGQLVKGFKPVAAKTTAKKRPAPEDADMVITARLRPMSEDEKESGMVSAVFGREGASGVADLHELRKTVRGTPGLTSTAFSIDRLFTSNESTEDIYRDSVQHLVPWAWSGGVSTIFAYGQTGSGKTFTISGLEDLVAKALTSDSLEGTREMYISIVELAGNAACDLLNARRPVSLLEDSFGSTHLAGAAELRITDTASLLAQIATAAALRSTASTQKNDASSRSHAICRIRLENPVLPQADDGLLYMIDLAGSEAARDVTAHSADRMREAKEINASLSTLKDCIRGRASLDAGGTGKTYLPYRQSALTKLLKHVFDPATERSCRTVVIACVNPCLADVAASKNTLRYAELLKVDVPKTGAVKYDAGKPATWSNEQLHQWVGSHSGTPAISPDILAPTETGKQLLRLPAPEFISRALKTPGVTVEQATAFQSKFWRLHVDSQHAKAAPSSSAATENFSQVDKWGNSDSSRDARPEMAGVPFKERIRPGMVVTWEPAMGSPGYTRIAGRSICVVLSREDAADETAYRCALVNPGLMPGAFEVNLWRQWVVKVDQMTAEVLLDYDAATRYYYESV
ncbi:P-loop containing nucleoside triphosphate hydrolase protein [Plectosphaerella plurivora]|uniref:P-loop containing nucleoside triphosphate hydrolase protein n=1 Tax=Plectosphaerella plurivora TaxID=936078 RepID=A0A9P8VFX1_9PEZI|nr:P-loop containing nucleoside triphosphate hydrolase protein [Plectosphaerella plurivora]